MKCRIAASSCGFSASDRWIEQALAGGRRIAAPEAALVRRGRQPWIFSPRASIATSVLMRLVRVSGLIAVWTRHSTA
jgi:hypothetical protein